MRAVILAVLALLWFMTLFGQVKDDSTQSPAQKIKREFLKSKDSIDAKMLNQNTLISQARQLSDEQFRTGLALEKQKQKQVDDENFAMQHRWRSFNFQYEASIVIFVLVILIVITGLFFSGWQFSFTLKQIKLREQALKIANQKKDLTSMPVDVPPVGTETKQPAENSSGTNTGIDLNTYLKNELEVSTSGIKVNSSVLGVIILILSIAFFYLYILYVYPIKYISFPPPATTNELPAAKK